MISRYLFHNPQIVALIAISIVVAGISCLMVMPRLEDPVLKKRVGAVTVTSVGASPTEMESLVVVPIEEWLNQIPDVKRIRSNARSNVANIVVELTDGVTDPDPVWSKIERTIRAKSVELPPGCSEPELTVFPLKAFAAIIAVVPNEVDRALNKQSLQLEKSIAETLKQRLLQIDGTQSVELFGSREDLIKVNVAPETLVQTGLSTASIAQQISSTDPLPGGNVQLGNNSIPLQLQQHQSLIHHVENSMIRHQESGQSWRLGDLASVAAADGSQESDTAIVDERRAIVLGAMVDDQRRVDLWTKECLSEIERLKKNSPSGSDIRPLFLQSEQIQQRMDGLLRNLLVSTIAVVFVVLLFLGWRCMLVVAVTLPLCACLVVVGLRILGIPIHQMSVTGLIVSLGLLIDNAIVMVEEVRSRVYRGQRKFNAIEQSIRHLRLPLLGSTITTVLTFLPIALMQGPSGEFVGSLAISVILAIGASMLLAFTIVPPMVALLGVDAQRRDFLEYGLHPGPLARIYQSSLRFVFKRPIIGVWLGVALPALGFWFSAEIRKQFFPATDRAQIQIELDLALSNNLDAVRDCVARAEAVIRKNSNVESQYWFLGRSAPTFYYNVVPRRKSTPNYAQAFVDLEKTSDIDRVVKQLQRELDSEVLDARVVVQKLGQGPPIDAPIEIRIFGNDRQVLADFGNQLRKIIAEHPRVTHTRSDLGDQAPRLELKVESELANRVGLSEKEISKRVFMSVEGSDAGVVSNGVASASIQVAVDYTGRSVLNSLLALPIAKEPVASNPTGASLPNVPPASPPAMVTLGALADFQLNADPGAVIRLNGEQVNEVKAYLQTGVMSAEVLDDLKAALAQSGLELPAGCRMEFGGESEKRSEAILTLAANITIIVAMMIVTLVAVLGSIRLALVIGCVAGLVIGLAPLALFSFGFPFGFMAIVGAMGLVGIAINDSIVVLAGISEDLGRPSDADESFQSVSEKLAWIVTRRTRHILATTLTTMVGFLPLVLDGGKFWPPLAIVIASGVGGATLLALYFTPSLFRLLHPGVGFDLPEVAVWSSDVDA